HSSLSLADFSAQVYLIRFRFSPGTPPADARGNELPLLCQFPGSAPPSGKKDLTAEITLCTNTVRRSDLLYRELLALINPLADRMHKFSIRPERSVSLPMPYRALVKGQRYEGRKGQHFAGRRRYRASRRARGVTD